MTNIETVQALAERAWTLRVASVDAEDEFSLIIAAENAALEALQALEGAALSELGVVDGTVLLEDLEQVIREIPELPARWLLYVAVCGAP